LSEDCVIGIDLGGTKTLLGLITQRGEILVTRRIPTRSEEGAEAVVGRLLREVEHLRSGADGAAVSAVGICTPGPVDVRQGRLLDPPNIPGLHGAYLRQMLEDGLGVPVVLEHDARAAAMGEFVFGAGRGLRSLVYIIVGTGVGAAIISDGKLYYGEQGFSGEAGHITLDMNGDPCPSCGTRGCAESYMSGPALARRYRAALEETGCLLDEDQVFTGEMVADLARQGDPLAGRILEHAGEALGVLVASLAMVLNIETFVIGGGVAGCGEEFLEPARRNLLKYCYPSVGKRVHILCAELGARGALLGCGWLARRGHSEKEWIGEP
jgi:glucokinase